MGLMKEHVIEMMPTFTVTADQANERVLVEFEYPISQRGNIRRASMAVEFILNLDGDMGSDGVTPRDYSSWLPVFKNENVADVQRFMDSAFGNIDFSDVIRPVFKGWCGEGGPDYDQAVTEITELIKSGME